MSIRRRVCVVTVAVLAAAASVAAPADADPAGDDIFAVQLRLVAAADAITAAVQDGDGLAGISATPERGELWVYWKGDVPRAVDEVIGAQRLSVPIRVIPAPFSQQELLEAAAVVAEQPGVTAVGPLTDGSGLTVSTLNPLDALSDLPIIRERGIPLVHKDRQPFLLDRHNAPAPFYGGATFTFPVGQQTGICTTGFAVATRAWSGILTAGHCGADGDTVYNGVGQFMGTVWGDNNTKDTMIIKTSSTAGRVFADAHNSNVTKPVSTVLGSYEGVLVCADGSMTGEHCRVRITGVNLTINVGYPIFPVVEAEHDWHFAAAGQGDSGGPIVAQDSWGPFYGGDFTNVYAMGTLSAGDMAAQAYCGLSWFPTMCSYRIYYADVTKALSYYHAVVIKG